MQLAVFAEDAKSVEAGLSVNLWELDFGEWNPHVFADSGWDGLLAVVWDLRQGFVVLGKCKSRSFATKPIFHYLRQRRRRISGVQIYLHLLL